ncbi:MAG TPA: outer membrane protein assembly factor BamA [Xanthobacteraceae bacterium]|nr:outer membrane protein assembly factor BamA [Xanthobacteraceae bacterium]
MKGNHHAGADMIRSYFHGGAGGRLDADTLDAALKSLYATGLFANVKISRDGDRVVVTVVENPTIARLAFEGNKKLKDDDLKKAVQSKENGPLWRAVVQADVEHIVEAYRQHGYYDTKVTPQTIKAKNGRVNLVFEIKESDKVGVRQIVFVGNNAFPATKLTGVIKTGKTNVLSFLLDNDVYDTDKVENDAELLRQFYRAHGYDDVHVAASASSDTDKGGIVVVFKIDEGLQYRVGTVDIQSTVKSVDVAPLRQALRTEAGDTYDAGAVDKTVDDLSMALAKNGEPFASVAVHSERLPDRRVINLTYTIEQGKRLYVERIDIHGNTKTRDEVIRREFDFGEGDAFNRALVDRAERHLKALGYFKSVKITSQPGSAPDRVIVDVAVEEQGTGDFTISGGYSTSMGALAQVSVGDKNILGTGFTGKASVTYGQYARSFDVAVTDPYALGPRLSLGTDFFGSQSFANSYQSWDGTIYGAKLLMGTPLSDQLGVTWNYSIYNQGLSLPAGALASLPVQQAAAAGPSWVSSIGNSVIYSTLDNNKNPTSGIRAQFNDDFAGLGGATKFAKSTQDVRYYHPIVGDLVGMVRAQGGYVTPWGGQSLPLLDGFFGGPQLVRGFAPNGFGPRDITPGTTMDNIGGNAYWTTSAELQAPVPGIPADANLKAALFSDVGSLWATGTGTSVATVSSLSPAQQIANARAPRASLGAGLIWDSPFGPLQVDYAYPIAKQPFDITQRLQFTAGAF